MCKLLLLLQVKQFTHSSAIIYQQDEWEYEYGYYSYSRSHLASANPKEFERFIYRYVCLALAQFIVCKFPWGLILRGWTVHVSEYSWVSVCGGSVQTFALLITFNTIIECAAESLRGRAKRENFLKQTKQTKWGIIQNCLQWIPFNKW